MAISQEPETVGTVCAIDVSSAAAPRVKLLHAGGEVSEWVSPFALLSASAEDTARLAEATASAKRTEHEHAHAQMAAATLGTHAAHVAVRAGAHAARRQKALADEVGEADHANLECKRAIERVTQLTECSPSGEVKGPRYFWASVVDRSGTKAIHGIGDTELTAVCPRAYTELTLSWAKSPPGTSWFRSPTTKRVTAARFIALPSFQVVADADEADGILVVVCEEGSAKKDAMIINTSEPVPDGTSLFERKHWARCLARLCTIEADDDYANLPVVHPREVTIPPCNHGLD